ncbi:MAG: SCO1664 family protein [Candidatus Nanopelagicaceae bacterium]|nr:SCO1664 family protein [Candidatus Nanopelagicaceae bacterium]
MSQITVQDINNGELIVEGRLIDASNATLFGKVVVSPSIAVSVVYKPVAGEKPLWDFPSGSLAGREVCAYELSSAVGFDLVPITVFRDGPFGPGAVQEWIDIPEECDVISRAQEHREDIRSMALFDAVINNTDRKFGHILFDEQGKLYGCDHGVTFHEEDKLRTVLWQFAGERLNSIELAQLDNICDWLDLDSSSSFRNRLSSLEISALIQRIDRLKKEGFPYPSEDWPAIPWPPV